MNNAYISYMYINNIPVFHLRNLYPPSRHSGDNSLSPNDPRSSDTIKSDYPNNVEGWID